MEDADLAVIEGMMGLFDGVSATENQGSTAHVAKQLNAPVLLVVDGSAMARSVTAVVIGFSTLDSSLRVIGVVFNRVNSEGHYALLKSAVESSTSIKVIGYFKNEPALKIKDRHLGLAVAFEQSTTELYERLGKAGQGTIDWKVLDDIIQTSSSLTVRHGVKAESNDGNSGGMENRSVRGGRLACIGVAYDVAFCFYYQENLETLRREGAEIVFFSPLHEGALPDVDLLYLGGGYPELHAKNLSENVSMRKAILEFAQSGNPVYAECGGLMYLTEAIQDFSGETYPMVGLYPFDVVMDKTKTMIAYRNIEVKTACLMGQPGVKARGHEFHYSYLRPRAAGVEKEFACEISDVSRSKKGGDGLMVRNTLALYTHIHFGCQPSLARSFVKAAQFNSMN